ncbi:hypothetical protein ABT168_37600, partial [Streptomyces sp. NPDC001793]
MIVSVDDSAGCSGIGRRRRRRGSSPSAGGCAGSGAANSAAGDGDGAGDDIDRVGPGEGGETISGMPDGVAEVAGEKRL